jgi:protein involved in polysaccharide export with SLBB domain/capsular polysaccharide biosynthesis protein
MNETTARSSIPAPSAPFDTWAVLDFWLRRWHWLVIWTVLFAAAGAFAARYYWGRSYSVSAQLIHYAPSAVDDSYRPRDIAAPSLVLMLQSQSLYEKVGAQQTPPLSAKQMARRLQFQLDRNNDIATVSSEGADREATVGLVNQFTTAAIEYTQALQKQEALAANDSVKQQLKEVEAELAASRSSVPKESAEAVAAIAAAAEPEPPAPVASDLPQRLQAAHDKLDELLVGFTDAHPLVREQRARVASLEESSRRAAAAAKAPTGKARPASVTQSPVMYGRVTPEEVAMGERLRTLEGSRALLIARQRALQPFLDQPPGYFRVLMPATAARAIEHGHRLEMVLCGILGAFLGLGLSAGQILLSEFMDNRIKTRADVRRVTKLPLLATLGDLKKHSPADVEQWAFRAWTALQSHLSLTANHGMVCGITSAHTGDGRSTWIKLLASAASACGFRVLTITAQPSPAIAAELARREKLPVPPGSTPADDTAMALNANVLTSPGQITERLSGIENAPAVNIPLPGWVWNLDRRKQWQNALEVWRTIENVVIFVELPPASVSETVLLAENIPNLLWLVDSHKSDAAETHSVLETLRHARCNLVGAVLNRERALPIRGRFSRWMGATAMVLPLAFTFLVPAPRVQAAEPAVSAPAPALNQPAATLPSTAAAAAAPGAETFSIVAPGQRSAWQQKLTLGPGDILSFHVFGAPELSREEVPIGPDGRISYLEAENIMAGGLTVDELRAKLDEELGKFRRAPQTFVTPIAYHSKKYYVLGSTVQKGVFPLDRPITVIEAVARARGFENTTSGGNVVESTDFSRSFVGRGGKRLPVDFEKLFLQGDLSQNVALEPNDYLYFPAGAGGQVYVLGEVRTPGAAPCDSTTSVLSVIAARGGFSERAWAQRVMVVRGSLERPQTFKVDISGVLTGDAANFALKPGDLIYVSARPWIRAEELLDRAASAFVESAVISWTGIHVGPGTTSDNSTNP